MFFSRSDLSTAHAAAYSQAKVLHCDISIGNIIITKAGRGLLIDWDLCLHTERDPGLRATWRTVRVHFCSRHTSYLTVATLQLCPDYVGIELGIGESLLLKAIGESTGRSLAVVKADLKKEGDLGLVAKVCVIFIIIGPQTLLT